MRDLVQQVTEGHKNSKAAKVKLQEFKQRIGTSPRLMADVLLGYRTVIISILVNFMQKIVFTVKEVSQQSRELLRQALEEAQAELSRKFEIIREIHAIESVPHMRYKFVDDTEVS